MSVPGPARGSCRRPTGSAAEFYDAAAAAGALHLQRCDACATWRHPPRYPLRGVRLGRVGVGARVRARAASSRGR